MRINQFVATASGLSRRAADAAIASGRVRIAGRPAKLGELVPPGATVELDNQQLVSPTNHIYLIFNKPVGYISSHARQGKAPTIYNLLPPEFQRLRLAGRLDRDSSGLVLLSDDGQFINRYSHPTAGKRKTYELTLTRPFEPADPGRLAAGVELDDGVSHVELVTANGRELTVNLVTGRNRQLRRTFGALGYDIERLHRTHIGPYELGELKSGAWQKVEPK